MNHTNPSPAPFTADVTVGKIMDSGGALAFFNDDEAAYISPHAVDLFDMKTGDIYAGMIVPNRSAGSVPWFVQHVSPSGTRLPEGLAGHIVAGLTEFDALDLEDLVDEVATRSSTPRTQLLSGQVRAIAESLYHDGTVNKVLILSKRLPTETFFTALAPNDIEITGGAEG